MAKVNFERRLMNLELKGGWVGRGAETGPTGPSGACSGFEDCGYCRVYNGVVSTLVDWIL